MNTVRFFWCLAAVFLVGFAIFESIKYGWVAACVIVGFSIFPDVPILPGFRGDGLLKARYVGLYNVLHSTWIPLAFMLAAMAPIPALGWGLRPGKELFLAGVAWLLHITVDRAVGFGVRERDGSIRRVGTRGRASVDA